MKEKKQVETIPPIRYNAAAQDGLTQRQVEERLKANLFNKSDQVKTKPITRIIRDNLCTLFNLINLILGAMVLIAGSFKNLLFLGIVTSNIVIGIVQEIYAKRLTDKLTILNASKATVVRDGKKQEINIEDVVLDDVIEFRHGEQITADSIVLSGECDVNESLVTGESDSIHKKAGDLLLSGSFVVSGKCRARVEHIGKENYVSTIADGAKQFKKARSVIMESLQKIIRIVSVIIVPLGILMYLTQLHTTDWRSALVGTAASLIAMIPEGLILLTSSVLAVSVIRLSKHKVLVQELYCIEILARVDTLCLDKTGTITEGSMRLNKVIPLDGGEEEAAGALGALCGAMDDHTPTFEAIRTVYGSSSPFAVKRTIPFSSERKWSAAVFEEQGTYILGAPEFILKGSEQCVPAEFDSCMDENRVLLLAHTAQEPEDTTLPKELTLKALVLIQDVIRPDAADTLKYFAEQGVDLKVISGDNPVTVMNIARQVGLKNAENYVDASTLKTDEEISAAVERCTVFGRVSPMQKKKMVECLKKQGHTVAMTGDGVNDVLALKEADCSVAMASGSSAARNISQLVLLDSSFSSMPRVVAEGRRAVNNIQRSASLFLVKTIYACVLAVVFPFLSLTYPFEPIQLTLINVMTIGIPSFVLALGPNRERIRGNFIKIVFGNAIPSAIAALTGILCTSIISASLHLPHAESSTISVILAGACGLLLVFKLCLPFNWLRGLLFATVTSGFLIGLTQFQFLFSLRPLSRPGMILLGCLLPAILFLFCLLHYAAGRLERGNEKKEPVPAEEPAQP